MFHGILRNSMQHESVLDEDFPLGNTLQVLSMTSIDSDYVILARLCCCVLKIILEIKDSSRNGYFGPWHIISIISPCCKREPLHHCISMLYKLGLKVACQLGKKRNKGNTNIFYDKNVLVLMLWILAKIGFFSDILT